MTNFIAAILIKVLSDKDVQASIEKLIGNIIAKVVRDEILPAIPVAIGGAVKAGVDDIIEHIPGVSGVVDIAKTTEGAVSSIENLIPGLGGIGDLLKSWGINL